MPRVAPELDDLVRARLEIARDLAGASTKKEWAERLGIDPRHYWNYRRGEARIPEHIIARAAHEAGVPVSWFYEPIGPDSAISVGESITNLRERFQDSIGKVETELEAMKVALRELEAPKRRQRPGRPGKPRSGRQPQ